MLLFLPAAGVFVGVVVLLWASHWVLIRRHAELGNERKFTRQLVMLGLTLLGLLAIIFVLPIGESAQNKLLGLIGILISGIIAFSSTTIFANLAAGILLRITKPFQTGDFIQVGEHFGRVTERGLFDTEIQTETRELVALPNAYCISNPVETVLGSGTIISATLSLGYDVHHGRIERLLVQAAQGIGLEDPFVHILELGNFAVTYRVSGFLKDPKLLISERSRLYASVLDALHGDGVEIMSPSFMNQKPLPDGYRAMPETRPATERKPEDAVTIESIAFDKADRATELETEKQTLLKTIEESEADLKTATDDAMKTRLRQRIDQAKERLKTLNASTGEDDANGDTATDK